MSKAKKTAKDRIAAAEKETGLVNPHGVTAPVAGWRQDGAQKQTITASELPVAVSYDGTTHGVMMATPDNLEDFAVGFSLTEGVIQTVQEIEKLETVFVPGGIDVRLSLTPARRDAFQARRRHMAGPVGCGLCGIESIEAVMRPIPVFKGAFRIKAQEISKAVAALSQHQPLNDATRCAHAAGFYVPGKGLAAVREDIGRHNALDKLIGALLAQAQIFSAGIIVVTSRLSVEMVQKAALAGVPLIAAVSAPTAKAVQVACDAHITLVARVRGGEFDIMTCPERVIRYP